MKNGLENFRKKIDIYIFTSNQYSLRISIYFEYKEIYNIYMIDKVMDILPDDMNDLDELHIEKFNELILMDGTGVYMDDVEFVYLHPEI